ncbi:MAG: flagellar motor protein MotB [Alphaproteobacteria bacterium]
MSYRWHQKRAQPNHADDWLMTYADMITLLLCFFAIIIIASVPKKNVHPKETVQPVVVQQEQTPSPLVPAIVPVPQPKPLDIFPGNLPFHEVEAADDPLPIKDGTPVTVPVEAPIEVLVPSASSAMVLPSKDVAKPTGDRIRGLKLTARLFSIEDPQRSAMPG